MIRSLWVGLFGTFSTLFFATCVVVAGLLRIRSPRLYDWAARDWSRSLLWASGTRVMAEGLDNVLPDRPQIVVSNHQSWFDVFALAVMIPKRFHFVAKQELGSIPIFGRAWKTAGHISIDRSNRPAAIRSLDQAARQLHEEKSAVVIFPEGTRSATGELLQFKKGAFMLALQSGVEIVPTAVSGSREVLPKGGWRIRPGRIIVRFGEPVQIPGERAAAADRLISEVRARVQALRDPSETPRSVHEHSVEGDDVGDRDRTRA